MILSHRQDGRSGARNNCMTLPLVANFRRLCHSNKSMSSLKLNLIAACDAKMGIGRNNDLPWKLRNEMAYFNRMTTGVSKDPGSISGESKRNVVVMGRKTWDSIPIKFKPLKNRVNVILSRTKSMDDDSDDIIWCNSWNEIVDKLTDMNDNVGKIWIIGGSFMYKLALESPHCHRVYLTKLQNDYNCDVFFPNFDQDAYHLIKDAEVPEEEQEENGIKYNFCVYEKVK